LKKYGGVLSGLAKGRRARKRKAMGLLDHFDEVLKETQSRCEVVKNPLKKAQNLTAQRKKAGEELARRMEKELASLAMGKTKFEVRIGPFSQDSLSSRFSPPVPIKLNFTFLPMWEKSPNLWPSLPPGESFLEFFSL
jgi:DNA repair ATPase RecN